MTTYMTGETIVTPEEANRLEWAPLDDFAGVHVKTLWRDPTGTSYAGLLRIDPGTALPSHVHHFAVHHMRVEEGSCEIGDRVLEPGAYAHVPVGAEHGIDRAGPDGCTLFYLYLTTAEFD